MITVPRGGVEEEELLGGGRSADWDAGGTENETPHGKERRGDIKTGAIDAEVDGKGTADVTAEGSNDKLGEGGFRAPGWVGPTVAAGYGGNAREEAT